MHQRSTALVILLALVLAACVPGESSPASCSDPEVTITTTLANNQLTPANLTACRDQHIIITVTVEQDGTLHLHGFPEQVDEEDVTAGTPLTIEFDAVRSGQFPIELHPTDGSDEVEVGTLTVREP